MIALLDADILVYRVGFTTQDAPESLARVRMDELILNILADLQTQEYVCVLSPTGKNSFRYRIYPEYKANRKAPKPVHYAILRDYLIDTHAAQIPEDLEADDGLGLLSTELNNPELGHTPIIVSIDKDLNQIPGWHYNFVNKIKYYMDELEAKKSFYIQLLMGDVSDNIPGIPGLGIVKATRIIDPCTTEEQMREEVRHIYQDHFKSGADAILERNQQLIKIRYKTWQNQEANKKSSGPPWRHW